MPVRPGLHVLLPVLAVGALGLVGPGCGGDDDGDDGADRELRPPASVFVSRADAERVLSRRAGVTRVAPRARTAARVRPAPTTSARYATPSGEEFDLLVFRDRAQARAAGASIEATPVVAGGGAVQRAANVAAVFAAVPRDGELLEAWNALRRLGDACSDPEPADARLRQRCAEAKAAPVPDRAALTLMLRARDPDTERWSDRVAARPAIPVRLRAVVRNLGPAQATAVRARVRLPSGLGLEPVPVTVRTVRPGLGRPIGARRLLRDELDLGPLRARGFLVIELTVRAAAGTAGRALEVRARADAPRTRAEDELAFRVLG